MKKQLLIVTAFVLTMGAVKGQQDYYDVNSGNDKGIRFWSSDEYKISMGNSSYYKYGPVQDYSIKMGMSNNNNRGWTWGALNQTPIAAIDKQGNMQIERNFVSMGNIGIGNTTPIFKLSVSGNETPQTLGKSKNCAVNINNNYASTFGANSELQFSVGGHEIATIAGKYTDWGGNTAGALLFGTRNVNSTEISERMRITKDGNVGIGTSNPMAKLQVDFIGENSIVAKAYDNGTHGSSNMIVDAASGYVGRFLFRENGVNKAYFEHNNNHIYLRKASGSPLYTVDVTNGIMGIGTSNFPTLDYNLYVTKGIRTEKIKVDIASSNGWADYVFADDYKLMPLSELKTFVEKENHLPNVPTTEEMMENGSDLANTDRILLEKIEELTLYTIQQEETINSQEELLNSYKADIDALKKQNAEMMKLMKELLNK